MVPPGLVQGFNQAEANQIATSYINQHILSLRFCLSDFSGSFCVGQDVSVTLTVTGGIGPFTFSSESVPEGFTLTPSGDRTVVFHGTASIGGSFSFQVRATDPLGDFMEKVYDFDVTEILTDSLPDTFPLTPYSAAIQVLSGQATSFHIRFGNLPTGLTMDTATGVISGAATTPGTYPFTVQIDTLSGNNCLKDLSIHVYPIPIWSVFADNILDTPVYSMAAGGGVGSFSANCQGGVQDGSVDIHLNVQVFNDLLTAKTVRFGFLLGYVLKTDPFGFLQSTAQFSLEDTVAVSTIASQFVADGAQVSANAEAHTYDVNIPGNSNVNVHLLFRCAAAANAGLSLTSSALAGGGFTMTMI